MRAHQGTSPRAIQRRTRRSSRATWRFAHTSSRVRAIAFLLCPAGRDMARRFGHQQTRSSLGLACTTGNPVHAFRGASAGRASFFHHERCIHSATVAPRTAHLNERNPTRARRV